MASADLVILFTRLLPLPVMERERIVTYADSGKPIIALRTANHGFRDTLPYQINGKQFRWGDDVLGGAFMGHLKVAAIPTSAFVGSRPAGVGGLTGAR